MKLAAVLFLAVAYVRAAIPERPLAPTYGDSVLTSGGKQSRAPFSYVGGYGNQGLVRYFEFVTDYLCGGCPDRAFGLLGEHGKYCVAGVRSQRVVQIHDTFCEIVTHRKWSCAGDQMFTRISIMEPLYELAYSPSLGGTTVPGAKEASTALMEGATRLGLIGGDPSKPPHYSLGELARSTGVHPIDGVMLSIAACFAQDDKLRGAAELCSRLALGIPNCEACVFGSFLTVFARSGKLTAGIIGNPGAYDIARGDLLPDMIGNLQQTAMGFEPLIDVWKGGGWKMAIRFMDSGVSIVNRQLRRHTSQWLLLEEVSPGVAGMRYVDGTVLGVSRETFAKLYGTQEYALACVASEIIQNGGVGSAITAAVRPTAARKIHVRAMSRLFHFLLVHLRNEGSVVPPPDDEDWLPPWLTLLFTFVAQVAIYKVTDVICSKAEALIQAGISREAVAESAAAVAKGGALIGDAAAEAAKPLARFLSNKAVDWVRRVNAEGKMEEMAHFAPSEPFPEIHSNFGPFEMTVASIEQGAVRLKELAAAMPPYARAADADACYDGVPAAFREGVDMRMEMRREADVEEPSNRADW